MEEFSSSMLWLCSLLLLWGVNTPTASAHSSAGSERFSVHRHASAAAHHHHHHHHHRRLHAAVKKGRSPAGGRNRCGAQAPDVTEQAQFNYQLNVLTRNEVLVAAAAAPPPFAATVPVAFHVVHDGEKGWVEEQMLQRQIEVVNAAFSDTGFLFEVLNVTYTDNATWFALNGSADYSDTEEEMKRALRVGGSDTLNVFIVNLFGFLGKAEFPYRTMATNPNSPWLVWDGILLSYEALPGGPLPLYNVGHTLTHEIGHWLNLLHTFEGGCVQGNRGDYVTDTPSEREANQNTCDMERDSCKGLRFPGRDPVLNFMDYSPDQCYKNFSRMQINRMQKAWRLLRTAQW